MEAWTYAKGEEQCAAARGSALIAALWTVLLLSLLIATLAFDLQVEAEILSHYRKRVKSQFIAQSGMALAKVVLAKMAEVAEDDMGATEEEEELLTAAYNLNRGVPIRNWTRDIGEGTLDLTIEPEEGRRNVNELTRADWEEVLDQANIPSERWDELIDCFLDWVDTSSPDTHRLHGADSSDPFYVRRGYKVKGAPLDTIDELLLIKGFDEDIVFGSPPGTPPEEAINGIAYWLTTWSHGKVNINTASREVLLTLPDIEEWQVDEILELRLGLDGEWGTRDDGIADLAEIAWLTPAVRQRLTVRDVHYLRITSQGEVGNVQNAVWGVMRVEGTELVPVYWREEPL
jgi:general secretion pathway protein K